MKFKTLVIRYHESLTPEQALSLTQKAEERSRTLLQHNYRTDTHIVSRTVDGYRISKQYDIEPIKRCEVEE